MADYDRNVLLSTVSDITPPPAFDFRRIDATSIHDLSFNSLIALPLVRKNFEESGAARARATENNCGLAITM
jgi:hypothetical protein